MYTNFKDSHNYSMTHCSRLIVILFFMVCTESVLSQSHSARIDYWSDDFRLYPEFWSGDTSHFNLESNWLRQTTDSGGGQNQICRQSYITFGYWEFSVLFDGFATSNQNRSQIWLAKNNALPDHGIMVRVGENGSNKHIRLFYVDEGGRQNEILRSANLFTGTTQMIKITVSYTTDHIWRLEAQIDDDPTISTYGEFKIPDSFYSDSFCYQTIFTSTRTDRYGFGPVIIERESVFVKKIEILNDRTYRMIFSENIESNNIDVISIHNTSIGDGKIIEIKGNSIWFSTDSPLTGGTHIFTVSGLMDPITGSESDPISIELLISDSADLFDIIIHEFTPRPDNNQDRFIEFFNRSDKTLSIDKWTIGRSTQAISVNYSSPILPGDLIVIGPNFSTNTYKNGVHTIHASIPVLARTQDVIWIKTDTDILIDSLHYNSSWGARLQNNRSVERINPDYIGMDPLNWTTHPDSDSKGQVNSNHNAEPVSIEAVSAFESDNSYEIVFNRYITFTPESRLTLNGTPVTRWEWTVWKGNIITIPKHSMNVSDNIAIWLDISDLNHFTTGEKISKLIEIGRRPDPGDVLINEILYQPHQERYSTFPDQSEFVELHNTRPYKITLRDMVIRDAIDKNGQSRAIEPVLNDLWMVEAFGYAVMVPDTVSNIENSRLAKFFGINPDHSWARADRSTLSLTSTGRDVILAYKDGIVIDSVRYFPTLHHPLIRDTRGISLERVEGLPESQTPKWTSSADVLGATPGSKNSNIYLSNNMTNDEQMSIHPNPFSPDLDGHDDVTVIDVTLQDPGYMVRLTIYDRYGHPRKVLINDVIAGSTLSVSWDGTNDIGNLLSTGVYILHLHARSEEKRNEINIKKPIVLVRKK